MRGILFIFALPVFLLADSNQHDYDIVARTINFLIFCGIIYYFIADKIKNAYNDRIKSIEKRLNSTREKVLKMEEGVEKAKGEVEVAKKRAEELVEIGKKQALDISKNMELNTQNEINFLKDTYEEQKAFDQKVLVKSVVNEVLLELFNDKNIDINHDDLINLVIKKVS